MLLLPRRRRAALGGNNVGIVGWRRGCQQRRRGGLRCGSPAQTGNRTRQGRVCIPLLASSPSSSFPSILLKVPLHPQKREREREQQRESSPETWWQQRPTTVQTVADYLGDVGRRHRPLAGGSHGSQGGGRRANEAGTTPYSRALLLPRRRRATLGGSSGDLVGWRRGCRRRRRGGLQ